MIGGRLEIILSVPENSIAVIPANYRENFLGFLYGLLDKNKGDFLHNKGYMDPVTGKRFKLFTFSSFLPYEPYEKEKSKIEYQKDKKVFIFHDCKKLRLVFSSLDEEIILTVMLALLKKGKIILKDQTFFVEGINITRPEYKKKIRIKTLSPITVYSTLYTLDKSRKKTYYYSPFEKEFERLIIENLNRKYRAFTGYENVSLDGRIKVIQVVKNEGKIIQFKQTVIKAWDGIFELELPEPLFYVAFGAGLGSKNSQGFGCIKEIN